MPSRLSRTFVAWHLTYLIASREVVKSTSNSCKLTTTHLRSLAKILTMIVPLPHFLREPIGVFP